VPSGRKLRTCFALVERQIGRGLTVGASYDYVRTTRLNFNLDHDLPTPVIRPGDASQRPFFGIVASTIGSPAVPLIGAQNRPITTFGNTGYVQVREPGAKSEYQALVFRAQDCTGEHGPQPAQRFATRHRLGQ